MFESLPGFRDFYPEDCARRNYIFTLWRKIARQFNFQEMDVPTLEPLELYTQKSGEEIVGQLFNFTDKGNREVSLRPELTPGVARLVGSKASSLKKPVKWFIIGENFRYEKQQKGRLRSHYQFNGDIFGEPGVGAEAELISLLLQIFTSLGLGSQDLVLRLSDRQLWINWLMGCGKSKEEAAGVLAIVDKMERESEEKSLEKLKKFFADDSQAYLEKIQTLTRIRSIDELADFFQKETPATESLDTLNERLKEWRSLLEQIEAFGYNDFVRVDLGIVRGLAYYTGFVFEVFERAEGEELTGRAVAGGGRYDHLLEKLGYKPMPAVGFGMGDVVLADLLEEKNRLPQFISKPDIYIISGANERNAALQDISKLRLAGFITEYPLKAVGFGKQFKQAGQTGARFALIYGESELAAGKVKVRDMQTGVEKEFPRPQIAGIMRELSETGLSKEDSM